MRRRLGPVAAMVGTVLLATPGCPERGEYEGPSMRFDGDGDHARIGIVGPSHPLALAGSTFTVVAWFRQEAGGDLYQRIVDKSDERVGHDGWALAADGASGQIHLYSHDGTRGGDYVSRRGAYGTDRWHHVAGVTRSDRYEIWIDGKKDGGAFFEEGSHVLPAHASAEMRLGTWNHDQGREWKGLLGEVAVFRRDLAPEEIVAIARAGGRLDLRQDRGAYRGSKDLVGYWRMTADPADRDRIPDLSATGADARFVRTGTAARP